MAGQPARVDVIGTNVPVVSRQIQPTKQLRMLYSSNAFWASSGYGVQGKSLLPRLAELPQFNGRENIAQFAWYGLQGGIHNVDGFTVYPSGNDPYGNDVIGLHTQDFRANIVISLIDVWVMRDTARKIAPALWLPWLPIDHDPVPDAVLRSLEGAYLPLTYAKWGHKLLLDVGVKNCYIPHGIEPGVFKVLDDREGIARFKREVMGNAKHLTVMVAANKGYPDRKAFQVQLRAWAEFAKNKPGAMLYIHTEPTPMYGGLDFHALTKALGIREKVIFPNSYGNYKGYPAELLAAVYNVADIFLGASMSEGFGIPIIEAQACGTPVVVTDFSAMPELVRWGYTVPPADKFWTQLNSWQVWPSVLGITEALESLYAEWEAGGNQWDMERRKKISALIHDEYDWGKIVQNEWAPLLDRLAKDAPDVSGGSQSAGVNVPKKSSVAALIIGIDNWEKYTKPLIDQIRQHEPDVKIVVIDNASNEPYPSEPHIYRTDRLCYSAAINKAKAYAGEADWYVVLSNDVECRGPFVSLLGQREPMAVGPFVTRNMGHSYLEGWCVCIHRNVWNAVGGWDEKYLVSSWEDVDFSQSVRLNGYETIEDRNLPFVHLDQKQRFGLLNYPGSEAHNYEYFVSKHFGHTGNE